MEEFAPAKLNLFLHVGERGADGYHSLASLAVFPSIADRLHAARAPELTLEVNGPFAGQLPVDDNNLVLRAAVALQKIALHKGHGVKGAQLSLTKNLPVASGLGGGSADAAAALRLLPRLWGQSIGAPALQEIALRLGADVPVCLSARPAMMQGRGERLSPAPALPELPMVLVNPGIPVATSEVFKALHHRSGAVLPSVSQFFSTIAELVAWLGPLRNDLEAPACRVAPVIAEVLALLRASPKSLLARMSGSGATCFALCASALDATALAAAIRTRHPDWWVTAAQG